MCLLFETIACKNGQLQNLKWHNARLNNSRKLLFDYDEPLFLEEIKPPEFTRKGVWKCRVPYDRLLGVVNFEPYHPKIIRTLRLVEAEIEYAYKYRNRLAIDELYQQRKGSDDIIIIKHGRVTDTSIANILLYDGWQWITSDTPLLEGTMRAQLIKKGKVKVKAVFKKDLLTYKKLILINALNPFDESRAIDISSVSSLYNH